jgi:hypothetical protein
VALPKRAQDRLKKLHEELDAGVRTTPNYTVRRAAEDFLREGLAGRATKTIKKNENVLAPILWSTLEVHTRRYGTTVLFSTHYLEEADQHAERIALVGAGRVTADGTPAQVKTAAGAGRLVRFRLLRGEPSRFAAITAVTALSVDGDRVTLRTADADATVWALYPERHDIADIADIAVAEASLEEAFLSLVASRAGTPMPSGITG